MKKAAPKTYRTTNWSSYNQALINRGNISIWFDPKIQCYAQPHGKHGRNQTYSDTAIQCCLMIKSLFRLSLRMVKLSAKNFDSQVNKTHARIAVLNKFAELGRPHAQVVT